MPPLSGSEPVSDLEKYNKDPAVRHTHNCYAFALDYLDPKKVQECKQDPKCRTRFHVPGKQAGHPGFRGVLGKRCSDVMARTLADMPDASLSQFSERCPTGTSKIAVVVDQKADLHYYRQGPDGWYVHKPGGREATEKDSDGVKIYNPELASRYYPREFPGDTPLNYNSFCGFMCIPRGKPRTIQGGTRKRRGGRGLAFASRATRVRRLS